MVVFVYNIALVCYNRENITFKETIMENIRIQDDLYTYVNQAKLDELVIPDDLPVAGAKLSGS